jgi:hypothetical protein
MFDGGTSTTTIPPLMMDTAPPLLTARFLGPKGVDSATPIDIPALVGAFDDIDPP